MSDLDTVAFTQNQSSHFQWRSRSVFILAMIGVTLSMKDFLVFPVMAAEHGGGAYIFLYAFFLFFMSLPLLIAELLIGRESKHLFVHQLTKTFYCSKHWQWLVGLSLLASILVLALYNVIAGWSLSFVFKAALGFFTQTDKESINVLLASFQSDPERMMLWHTLFVAVLLLISAQGIKKGIQATIIIVVPAMVVLLLVGLAYAMFYGDYLQSVEYLLIPDFSKINLSVVIVAMQQAFYTLSVGLGIFLIFGAKVADDVPLVYSGVLIVVIDLLFSIFTGLAIHSFVFSLDVLPGLDDELAFSLLPFIFSQLPYGQLFGTLFYVLLTIAAITTALALLEVFVRFLKQKYKLSRIRSAVIASVVTWGIGVLAIFSYTVWADSGFTIEMTVAEGAYRLVNEAGFQDVLIYVASHLLQPLIALLVVLFIAWAVDKKYLRQLLNIQNQQYFEVISFVLRYIVPSFVFIVWLSALGVIHYA